jgi:excisionase family DNA binding protein
MMHGHSPERLGPTSYTADSASSDRKRTVFISKSNSAATRNETALFTSPEPRNLIGIDELSLRLNIAKGTLYNWVYLRRIPFVKLGRAFRFDPTEIERVLQASSTLEEVGRR